MRLLTLCALLLASSLAAEEGPDCTAPVTQLDMNLCAAEAARHADEDLNLAYQMALSQARAMDQYLAEGDVPAEDMLRNAQRAWITFRDLACETESLLVRGGSMQPLLLHSCIERETRARSESLRFFGEIN